MAVFCPDVVPVCSLEIEFCEFIVIYLDVLKNPIAGIVKPSVIKGITTTSSH